MANTVGHLHDLEREIHQPRNQHPWEAIEKFRRNNEESYQSFERCTRQKVKHLFPNASAALQERMAQSVARRRIRFLYLERHQKKTSTLREAVPALQTMLELVRVDHTPEPDQNERAESVVSVEIPTGTFPSAPKLDPTGSSFTCPFCFLICPAEEAKREKQWR